MTAPTAQMRCLSPEKATELAERLRAEDGVPAALTAADGDMLRAPIDNIGFAFAIVATAVEEGYADDDDAGQFQQAAIDHAGGHPGLRTVGLFCDSPSGVRGGSAWPQPGRGVRCTVRPASVTASVC